MHNLKDALVQKYMAKANDKSALLMLARKKLLEAGCYYVATESFVRTVDHVLEGNLYKEREKVRWLKVSE